MKMTGAIRKQLAAFLEGFYDIIPRRLISIFNEQELELLLSGEIGLGTVRLGRVLFECFSVIIPRRLIPIFNEQELELLLSG